MQNEAEARRSHKKSDDQWKLDQKRTKWGKRKGGKTQGSLAPKRKSSTQPKKYRSFIFTINNWTDMDIAQVGNYYENDLNCKYLIVGFEIAPRTFTPHLQCYIYYTNQISERTFKNKRYMDHHYQPSNVKQLVKSYSYNMTDHDYHEFGERPIQGQRTDIDVMYKDIYDKNLPLSEVIKRYPQLYAYMFRSIAHVYEHCVRFDTKLITYDSTANPIKVLEQIRKIYSTGYDRIFATQFEMTPMEFAILLTSRRHRLIFHPECPATQNAEDYIIAHINNEGWNIYDEEKLKSYPTIEH